MAASWQQAVYDAREVCHLMGDAPALLLAAGVLWYLSPPKQQRLVAAWPPRVCGR